MTPEAEKEVLEYLRDLKRQNAGVTLGAVYAAVRNMANGLGELRALLEKKDAAARRRLDRHHARIWALEHPNDDQSIRPPAPSLSSEDSGSIDIAALGARARFEGRLPVRVMLSLVVCLVLLAGGFLIHMAIAAPAPPQPVHGATP